MVLYAGMFVVIRSERYICGAANNPSDCVADISHKLEISSRYRKIPLRTLQQVSNSGELSRIQGDFRIFASEHWFEVTNIFTLSLVKVLRDVTLVATTASAIGSYASVIAFSDKVVLLRMILLDQFRAAHAFLLNNLFLPLLRSQKMEIS